MNSLVTLLLQSLAVTVVGFTIIWLVSLWRRDASIVDPFWGTGFVIITWFTFLSTIQDSQTARECLLIVLVTVWGARLSAFLFLRNLGRGEDKRYASMRSKHGAQFWWMSFLTVFLLQSLILWIVSMPVQIALFRSSSTPLSWIDAGGAVIWLVGVLFETIGDWQMARFQSDPSNASRVMDRGLWRFTRHPNYFGDFCVWWGVYLIAAAGGAGWTMFSPLLMSFLLLKVSGVSLLEKTITSRRPDYASYQKRTSAFFPWPPKQQASL